MVESVILKIIYPVFKQCAFWTDSLLLAVEGKGVVLGVFMIVLVIGLLFIPMRGNAVTGIKLYSESKIHNGKKKAVSTSKKGD